MHQSPLAILTNNHITIKLHRGIKLLYSNHYLFRNFSILIGQEKKTRPHYRLQYFSICLVRARYKEELWVNPDTELPFFDWFPRRTMKGYLVGSFCSRERKYKSLSPFSFHLTCVDILEIFVLELKYLCLF